MPLERRDDRGISQGEGIENNLRQIRRVIDRRLSRFHESRDQFTRHAARVEEAWRIRIDHCGWLRGRADALQKLFESLARACARPFAPARLEQPKPHHVLEEPDRSAGAALVGDVGGEDLGIDKGRVTLDADQRPRARRNVGPARFERRAEHRAGRVVRRGRDDADRCRSTRRQQLAP